MSKNLRNKIIRLAHSKPELRKHLLPLVTKTAFYDKRETEKAIKDAIKYGQPNWNIDGDYRVQWKKDGCIIKSSIEFVIAGPVSGVYDESDFGRAQRYLVVSDSKSRAKRECEEHAESTLSTAFEDHDIPLEVDGIKSSIHFDSELGNGSCSLVIKCYTM